MADSRGASATGAVSEDGWFGVPLGEGEPADSGGAVVSFDTPLVFSAAAASLALGLVIGIADFGTARTTALARARW